MTRGQGSVGEVLHQSQQLAPVRKQYCLHSTSRTSGQDREMSWRGVGTNQIGGWAAGVEKQTHGFQILQAGSRFESKAKLFCRS